MLVLFDHQHATSIKESGFASEEGIAEYEEGSVVQNLAPMAISLPSSGSGLTNSGGFGHLYLPRQARPRAILNR